MFSSVSICRYPFFNRSSILQAETVYGFVRTLHSLQVIVKWKLLCWMLSIYSITLCRTKIAQCKNHVSIIVWHGEASISFLRYYLRLFVKQSICWVSLSIKTVHWWIHNTLGISWTLQVFGMLDYKIWSLKILCSETRISTTCSLTCMKVLNYCSFLGQKHLAA